MIELSDTKATETVSVKATVTIIREITLDAFGKGHAEELAKDQARKSKDTHDWTLPDGSTVTLAADQVKFDRY